MARIPRIVMPNAPHHIMQEGNNGQNVFFSDDDRKYFLETLNEQSYKYGLEIWSWCLMNNHIHLVATPVKEQSLSRAVGRTNQVYALYLNRQYGRRGHLWQNRFFSCFFEDSLFYRTVRFVERNPVRAGSVQNAWQYRWSSASAHITGEDPFDILDLEKWQEGFGGPGEEWRQYLRVWENEKDVIQLQSHTRKGRPLGSDNFIDVAEKQLCKNLRSKPVGRPGKSKNKIR